MELDDLRAFVALANAGSVSRAARDLCLTQSAVTRRLQRLEASLGASLLDRRTRPPALTEAGRVTLERGRRVLVSLRELRAAVTADGPPAGELRIGVAHALTEATLTEPVEQVRRAFSRVALRLATGWSRHLLGDVRSGSLDAAVIMLPEGEHLPAGIVGEPLGKERLVVVAARGRSPRRRQIADLGSIGWVLNPQGCAARLALQRALLRANVALSVEVETYNYDLQLYLVSRDRGMSLVPARILARSRYRSRLQTVQVAGLTFPLTIWIVYGNVPETLTVVLNQLTRRLVERFSASRRKTSRAESPRPSSAASAGS